jgi:hypothetical protein
MRFDEVTQIGMTASVFFVSFLLLAAILYTML